jgi:hypothetical protein
MSAVTRWVQYDVSETGVAGTGGGTLRGRGTRGYSIPTASVGDSFNIGATNNRLYIKADAAPASPYGITLASGSELDPRFVAKDITEKMHNAGQATTAWDQAQCVWYDGAFRLYSGTLGVTSSMAVSSGTNTAHLELGWGTDTEQAGVAENSTGSLNGDAENYVSVSGTYNGFFDETYQIVINKEVSIGTPSKDGSNTYTGTLTTGGLFNWAVTITYTLIISTTNGTTMGAGTGNVPTVAWTSTSSLDDGGPTELLYADYWYKIGTKGLMVKFSDAVFNTVSPAWTIACLPVVQAVSGSATAPKGTAQYIWASNRGDDAGTPLVTNNSITGSPQWTRLGSRGLYVQFNTEDPWPGANLSAGDEFMVMCTPPQPSSYSITNLNYGNVTVSTESPVRNVIFEILSGAVEISTVKFGVQSHGNFDHHGESNDDTYFRFGTVGPGNNSGTPPQDGLEWWANVTAADISSDVHPSYLYATKENLSVVTDADSSEALGISTFAGMVADPVWLNIKLGASEVGANSTINYRIYFDYA